MSAAGTEGFDPSVPEPGQPVRVRYTKWDGGPHWAYDTVYLGLDEYGVWLAGPTGTRMERPGAVFDTEVEHVQCFPLAHGHAATFWADDGEPGHSAVYVDITTVPLWSGLGTTSAEVTLVDLDLDVIRLHDGRLLVDDEDEFAEHQVTYSYPAELVASAEQECRAVYEAMDGLAEPYASVGAAWLARFGQR